VALRVNKLASAAVATDEQRTQIGEFAAICAAYIATASAELQMGAQ